ncbi:MAG: enoyl-CoA hydratase-related protein, partial [Desulfobacteraceae bacterium]
MTTENVFFEKKDGIATVFINRPKSLNALNTKTFEELDSVFDSLDNDQEVRVVLITGKGKAFVAGADIQEMRSFSALEAREFSNTGSLVFRKIELLKKPVIAVINGYALGGGCELAMASDIRLASEKAKFGQPETGLGIIPGFSGNIRLPRLVGMAKAKELIFTG